jgi:hypothetical protein
VLLNNPGAYLDKRQCKRVHPCLHPKAEIKPVLVSDGWQGGRLAAHIQVAATLHDTPVHNLHLQDRNKDARRQGVERKCVHVAVLFMIPCLALRNSPSGPSGTHTQKHTLHTHSRHHTHLHIGVALAPDHKAHDATIHQQLITHTDIINKTVIVD